MVYWWSLGSVDVCLEPIESREHLVSLSISFQWVLQEDNALRSGCNRVQSSEEHTGWRDIWCHRQRETFLSASKNMERTKQTSLWNT